MEHGIVSAGLGLAIIAIFPFFADQISDTLGFINCYLDVMEHGRVCVLP